MSNSNRAGNKQSATPIGDQAGGPEITSGEPAAAPADKPNPNPQFIEIWPLRTYQDAGEIKRRGGKSYTVPKRHADALIARDLATDKNPKD